MKNRNKLVLVILVLALALAVPAFTEGVQEVEETRAVPENPRLKLATTTSTENSGLLAVLVPAFEEKTGYQVDVIAVGTGAAISLGKAGDVDLVMVHARSLEDAFVAEGYGVKRYDMMYNDFVVLGPESDPAGIAGMKDASAAFAKIADAGADFISRGDNSGTHVKELALWKTSGRTAEGKWYKEAGQGMGSVITMTDDMEGYTIADRGTWLAMKDTISLKVVVEGDPVLFNPYGVIAVNPELQPHVNAEGADALIGFVTGDEGQGIIRNFKINGEPLFIPAAE